MTQAMPKRYAPMNWWDDSAPARTMTVVEPERTPRWSGLYDADGNKLMAYDEPDPVGFIWFGKK